MAEKKLSARIAARLHENGESGKKHKYLAIFIGMRAEIEEAAQAGWKAKAIWETLNCEKKFEGSYECFRSYFNKYIRGTIQIASPSESETSSQQPLQTAAISSGTGQGSTSGTIQRFIHPDSFDTKELMED